MRGRWQAAGLLACLLLVAAPRVHAADDLKVKLAEAQEAQEMGEEVAQPVKAKIVKEAPEAVLASGTGDVATTGALACCFPALLGKCISGGSFVGVTCGCGRSCTRQRQPPSGCSQGTGSPQKVGDRRAGTCAGDVENFCTGIKPGEGRLAACLTKQQTEEEKGNIEGVQLPFSAVCATCGSQWFPKTGVGVQAKRLQTSAKRN